MVLLHFSYVTSVFFYILFFYSVLFSTRTSIATSLLSRVQIEHFYSRSQKEIKNALAMTISSVKDSGLIRINNSYKSRKQTSIQKRFYFFFFFLLLCRLAPISSSVQPYFASKLSLYLILGLPVLLCLLVISLVLFLRFFFSSIVLMWLFHSFFLFFIQSLMFSILHTLIKSLLCSLSLSIVQLSRYNLSQVVGIYVNY